MNSIEQLNEIQQKLSNIERDLVNMKIEVWRSGESPLYCKKYDDSIQSIRELVGDALDRFEYVKWRISQLEEEKEVKA